MFTIFLIFHLINMIECFWLYQQKLRKTSLIYFMSNLILMITNLLVLKGSFNIKYSSIIYLEDVFIHHAFLILLWIMVNLGYLSLSAFYIEKAKRKGKQNKILRVLIFGFYFYILFVFMDILFIKIMPFLSFLLFIVLMILLLKQYILKQKNYILASIFVLLIFGGYSFFSYTGAARLEILLMGYPKVAYETGFEELLFYQEENQKKLIPVEDIYLKSGRIDLIEISNHMGIKFAHYIGL